MTNFKKGDFINYRIGKAKETLRAAQVLIENNLWNSAVNRLYYACFYAVSALLEHSALTAKTHTGVKSQFFLHFVKAGKISMELGKLYADLFDGRQKGDYNDFYDFEEETVVALFQSSKELLRKIEKFINAD
ncbi:HEPN domain-containing protein [soil metagenome]